jgi:hypothetical protein
VAAAVAAELLNSDHMAVLGLEVHTRVTEAAPVARVARLLGHFQRLILQVAAAVLVAIQVAVVLRQMLIEIAA